MDKADSLEEIPIIKILQQPWPNVRFRKDWGNKRWSARQASLMDESEEEKLSINFQIRIGKGVSGWGELDSPPRTRERQGGGPLKHPVHSRVASCTSSKNGSI